MGKLALFCCCAFVFSLPFEMMLNVQQFSGAKLIGIACVLSAALAFLAGHPFRLPSLPIIMRFAVAAWINLTLVWSLDETSGLDCLQRTAQLSIFVFLIWEFAVTYQDQLWLMRSLIFGMLVPLFMQLVSWGALSRNADAESSRVTGGGQDSNYLALMFAVSVVMAIYLATNDSKLERKLRWFYWCYVAAATVGTLLTGSRGGLVSLAVAAMFAAPNAGVNIRAAVVLKAIRYFIVIAIIGAIGYLFLPSALVSRFEDIANGGGDTFVKRWEYWQRGLEFGFLRHPLGGIGIGAYHNSISILSGEKTGPAHNILMGALVETGIIGLTLLLSMIFVLYRAAWRSTPREKWLLLGILSVWMVGALSSGSELDKLSWFLHAFTATMAVACLRRRPAGSSPRPRAAGLPVVVRMLRPRLGRS